MNKCNSHKKSSLCKVIGLWLIFFPNDSLKIVLIVDENKWEEKKNEWEINGKLFHRNMSIVYLKYKQKHSVQ